MSYEITWRASPNYSAGRNSKSIIAIVNHITAGSYPGCLTWLCNSAAKASAHYLVTKTGLIFQLVADNDTAWHAGSVNNPSWKLYDGSTNPNRLTIGIEHENLGGGELTEIQYQASLWLQYQLIKKYSIPIDRDHIIGHYQIDSVNRPNCPGAFFPWSRLISDLKEGIADMIQTTVQLNGLTIGTGYLINNRNQIPVGLLVAKLSTLAPIKSIGVVWDSTNKIVNIVTT